LLETISQQAITPQMLRKFASTARDRMRLPGGGRRDHLRALAQRVEVDEGEVRIMGSKGDLLRTLADAAAPIGAAASFVPKWRRRWDSNPRWASTHAQLATECFRPLSHASNDPRLAIRALLGKGERMRPGRSDLRPANWTV
jgi:site-specific DNA recombinase